MFALANVPLLVESREGLALGLAVAPCPAPVAAALECAAAALSPAAALAGCTLAALAALTALLAATFSSSECACPLAHTKGLQLADLGFHGRGDGCRDDLLERLALGIGLGAESAHEDIAVLGLLRLPE